MGKYLANYDGTLLVVSHDTELLSTAANSIAEVRGGKLELYKSRSHDQVRLGWVGLFHYNIYVYAVSSFFLLITSFVYSQDIQ